MRKKYKGLLFLMPERQFGTEMEKILWEYPRKVRCSNLH